MISHVLCPTDGSSHALRALSAAALLAQKYAASLSIILINTPVGAGMGPMVYAWPDDEATEILAAARAAATEAGAGAVHTEMVISSDAASGILDYARAHKVDHIVMGTGDKRGLSRLVLGSVAADVAARAPCSVTIAR